MRTISELLETSAQRFAPRIAIEEGDRSITYLELKALAQRAARALISLGIEHGDRVAIWAPNSWEWIVAALGIHSAGATLVPINTRYIGEEAQEILDRTGARALFTVEGFLGKSFVSVLQRRPDNTVLFRGDPQPGTIAFPDFMDTARDAALPSIDGDDISDILFTSGTTGRSKGVMTTHAQNLRVFATWSECVGLVEGDRYLIVNPFFHAFGYKAGWLAALMRGATILPHAVFDAKQVLKRIERDKVTVLPGPPTLYQSILACEDRTMRDLSSLRLAVTGASVIPVELIHRMRDELGFSSVITGYGLTEVCGVATMCRFDDDPETIARTSGRAIGDVEIRVVDDEGLPVAVGEPGEVVVRGYNVMKGYLDDPEATGEAIDRDGFLQTGDIGILDERGYLQITDRKKDMFISGGFNVYPAEVERILLERDDITQAAVIGISDDRLGEIGMALIVASAGLSTEGLSRWCKDRMAGYKIPKRFTVVDSLPLNASGKVQKFKLRQSVRNGS